LVEHLRAFLGVYPFRCGDCGTRFSTGVFNAGMARFTRCPKCMRMDLNSWSEEHYPATRWMRWKKSLGAKYYRCEYCRINFTSFRRRKERFSFHRWERLGKKRNLAGGLEREA
jgi:DNA-directed RNA polymerase subunit RPC12/RpoP